MKRLLRSMTIQQRGDHRRSIPLSVMLSKPCDVAFWESFFNDQSETAQTTRHSWKISSSLSLSFLVSLVIVRGTASCGACCCILEDEVTLWDLVSGRQSDVLLVQAASMAATLRRINRWRNTASLKKDTMPTTSLHSSLAAFSDTRDSYLINHLLLGVLIKYKTGLLWII